MKKEELEYIRKKLIGKRAKYKDNELTCLIAEINYGRNIKHTEHTLDSNVSFINLAYPNSVVIIYRNKQGWDKFISVEIPTKLDEALS